MRCEIESDDTLHAGMMRTHNSVDMETETAYLKVR